MKDIIVTHSKGVYHADIDITTDEWKQMLKDESIFDDKSLAMIALWYGHPSHQATSNQIMMENNIYTKSPYNGMVRGLAIRIIKYLNRFRVIDTDGRNTYFIIPFEGFRDNKSGNFVWKIRKELVDAIDELNLMVKEIDTSDELTNVEVSSGKPDGRKISYYTTKYERNAENRKAAIKIHGITCTVCGFNFEKTYGNIGKDFIEVHHLKPLFMGNEAITIDPKVDLTCVCSNCHRMIHRIKDHVLKPDELKALIKKK